MQKIQNFLFKKVQKYIFVCVHMDKILKVFMHILQKKINYIFIILCYESISF
jgi:hypothetical protein